MRLRQIAAGSLGFFWTVSMVVAQEAPAPPTPARGAQAQRAPTQAYTPTAEELAPIKAKLDELNAAIRALKDAKDDDDLIVDAESCAWVVNNIIRVPGGFIEQNYVNRCTTLLNDGLRRAAEIKAGQAEWPKLKGRVNRAFRSAVDGTAQPYHLQIPASYDPTKPIPLYVYLHGRSQYDPDLGMGWAGGNDRASAGGNGNGGSGTAFIRVEAFGRANNSYRFAGETDVLEAIASVRKRYNIDPDRILLSGFSLGGAGSWQLGLHNPDMFCGLEIDAGVIGQRLNMDGLSPVQRAVQSHYGIMIDHALNLSNIPLVGYAGENDAQLRSSTDIRAQLVREGYTIDQISQFVGKGKDINALFLATPKQGHSHATGETLRLINEFNDANFKRGRVVPDHIKFITYTTRYNRDFWITVDGMEANFSRASIDAERDPAKSAYTIKTSNVSRLLLSEMLNAKTISIDGDSIQISPAANVLLIRSAGHWKVGDPGADSGLRKKSGLQGPINDAFFDSFLCITPSGKPMNASVNQAALNELDRFSKAFTRDYLGEARSKADNTVTPDDIASSNLILFGDPGSNSMIARIAEKLPIKWTKDGVVVGDKSYSSADHMPVLIYPNPLNPKRYVVINTGLVTPRGGGSGSGGGYGDFAVLKISNSASETAAEGVFDESWKLPATK